MRTIIAIPNAIYSVKSINNPGSLALGQGLGESGEMAETDPSDNDPQLHSIKHRSPSSHSGQMAVKVYVCIDDLSVGTGEKIRRISPSISLSQIFCYDVFVSMMLA